MCAIDSEISGTAARLARLIAAAPSACLSKEDKAAVAEMKRLSAPVPECKAAAKAKTADKRAGRCQTGPDFKVQPAKASQGLHAAQQGPEFPRFPPV